MVRNSSDNWDFANTDEGLPVSRFGGGDAPAFDESLYFSDAWQELPGPGCPQRFVYDAYGRLIGIGGLTLLDGVDDEPDERPEFPSEPAYVWSPYGEVTWLSREPLSYIDGMNSFEYAGYELDVEIPDRHRCPCCQSAPPGIWLQRDPPDPASEEKNPMEFKW